MRCLGLPLILLVLCSCSSSNTDSVAVKNYDRIESGLIEFTSPAAMLEPDSLACANPKTLAGRMAFYKTPGVGMAIIENNRLVWEKAYGVLDTDTGAPVSTETIFEAASNSKVITAVMALYFVQNGEIDLDKDVNFYLKSWKVKENEFTKTRKVTLRRLLTHNAGMPATNYGHEENSNYPTLLNVLNGEAPALNKAAIPELEPGTEWQYSNVAFNVIQLLLEDVSGKSFPQLAEELVFKPLGMTRSSFVYPLSGQMQAHEAMPHDAEGASLEPLMHLTALAHGGLTTTPGDLARLLSELLLSYHGKSDRVLTAETTRMLFTKEFDIDPRIFGLPVAEGLGILLLGEGRDLAFIHVGSNLPGLNCWLIGWPEKNRGIVIMTNGVQGEMLSMEIITAFINME